MASNSNTDGLKAAGVSEDLQTQQGGSVEDISNKAQGHKANISNPNTSEASKEKSRQALKELGGEDAFYGKDDSVKKD